MKRHDEIYWATEEGGLDEEEMPADLEDEVWRHAHPGLKIDVVCPEQPAL